MYIHTIGKSVYKEKQTTSLQRNGAKKALGKDRMVSLGGTVFHLRPGPGSSLNISGCNFSD